MAGFPATLDDVIDMAGFFFKEQIHYASSDLIQKGLTGEDVEKILANTRDILTAIEKMDKESFEEPLRAYVEGSGWSAGQVFGVLRVAATGQKVSPPLFESMEIIGREKVLERLRIALDLIKTG